MSTKFYPLTVKDIRQETADTVSVSFEVPAELKQSFVYTPGQYLTFRMVANGEEIRRSYSICTSPSENDLRVAVKRLDKGVFSAYVTQKLKIGDTVEVMPPLGNFVVRPHGPGKNHVFFAAGSGITPIIAMVKAILENEPDSTVYLFYVNRTKTDTIFRNTLDQLAASKTNLKLTYLLTREDSGAPITNGRIDKNKCTEIFNTYLSKLEIDNIYSCGPQEMINVIKDFFMAKGFPQSKIHFELFVVVTPVKEALQAGAVDAVVTVIMDDEPYTFNLNTNGKSILQAAQDAGADVPFSCKGGVCCTCKAKVLEGSAKMDLNYALEPDEVDQGFILCCQSHPTSEKVVVSFDEY